MVFGPLPRDPQALEGHADRRAADLTSRPAFALGYLGQQREGPDTAGFAERAGTLADDLA